MQRGVWSIVLCCGFWVSAGTAHAGPTLDRIKQSGSITIGYRAAGLPFSYADVDKGPPLGYSIDICAALVEAIKQDLKLRTLNVKYTPVTAAQRIPAVLDGSIDLECAGTTNTKARREQVAFSIPHYFASAKVLTREGSGITGIQSFDGKTIAVSKNTTGQLIVEARKRASMPNINVLVVETSSDAVKAVEEKKADAFVNDDILLHGFEAQSKEKLQVVGAGLSIEPLAIMFAKNDPELATLVNREMGLLYSSGKVRQLYQKWFQSPLPQRNFNLDVAPNRLTLEVFARPSGYVVDWVTL